MIRACVVGWPIEHSRSPLIHSHWLSQYKIDGRYDKTALAPEDARPFFLSLADRGLAGCNVTVPLKEIAFETAQIVEPAATAVGAANTLWLDDDGRLCATNTDTYGFMTHLDETVPNWNADPQRPVAVLGAGGAARAIVYGFQSTGVNEIHVFNRTRDRAEALQCALGNGVIVRDWDERSTAPRTCSAVVNTTTIGMNGQGSLGIDFNAANPACVACDIVYVPLVTQFLASAQQNGLRTLDGLGMLLHQAVPGFEKWFGQRPRVTKELRDLVLQDL